jgi:hypothetical protein
VARTGAEARETAVFRPTLAVPEMLEPFVKHVEPGNDAFPVEREARDIERRLGELSDALREDPERIATIADWLLSRKSSAVVACGHLRPSEGCMPSVRHNRRAGASRAPAFCFD